MTNRANKNIFVEKKEDLVYPVIEPEFVKQEMTGFFFDIQKFLNEIFPVTEEPFSFYFVEYLYCRDYYMS